jgi:4-amino-4-deoxy-L-arabinose transferase-like glycosyltransferase
MKKYQVKSLKASAPILGVFCAALLVRLLYNVTVAQGYHPIYDAFLYYQIAWNMLTEHCYCYYHFHPTVSRSPLWPFIMAGIFAVTGQNAWYARLFYCFLGSGTCVLIYLFARDLFNRRIALVTGLISAVYTGLFLYDGWLFTESLYTFLLTFFAYGLYRLQISLPLYKQFEGIRGLKGFWRRYTWSIVSGIVLGLMTLARPNGVGFLVLLIIWAVFVIRAYAVPWRLLCKNVVLLACLAASIVAPWTMRNYRVSHSFVLVATGMGEVLLGSYNDGVLHGSGMWQPPKGSVLHDNVAYTPQHDSADTAQAITWILSHPAAVPYLMGLHLINMWKPSSYVFELSALPMGEFPNRLSAQILQLLIPIESWPIFAMAAAGVIVTLKKRGNQLAVVYLVLAFTIAENVVFYSNMRFRAPIEPLLVLLTGGFLWWLIGALSLRFKAKQVLQPTEAA